MNLLAVIPKRNKEEDVRPTAERSFLPALAIGVSLTPLLLLSFILLMIWTRTPHVPYWDEWETVLLVQRFTQGTLTWNDVWMFHNEHRVVVPQLLDLGLILATHWNRQIEMTFDLLLSVAEWALLLHSVARGLRSRLLTILAIAPLSLAIFSLTQFENWLWSYQIAFICTVFGVALCFWALTAPRATWGTLALALVGAVIAALSSLGGLAVFFAFLPAVISQGYKKALIWGAVAVGIIVPYMQGFPHSVPLTLTLLTLKFCIAYLGAPAGIPSIKASFALGAASVALAVANVLFYWARERRITPLLPWIGLGGYAIGLALMTSFGRLSVGPGLPIALTSRYQVFAALWWVAVIYLLLLNGKSAWEQVRHATSDLRTRSRGASWLLAANSLLLVSATVGLLLANLGDIPAMLTFQYNQLRLEACVVNVEYATTPCLWQFYPIPADLPSRVAYLRAEHFALFGEDYQRLAQPAPTPPARALVRYYDAATGDYWSTTSVEIDAYGVYSANATLGYLYEQRQPGTHALYTCVAANGHHVVSLNAACVGGTYLRTEGWLLNTPAAGTQMVELYDCASASGDFASSQLTCDGQKNDGALGYALTQLP